MLRDNIESFVRANGFDGYTEIRAQRNTAVRVGLLKGIMTSNTASRSGGVSARVVKRGAYGFASGNDASPEGVAAAVRAAQDNAAFLAEAERSDRPDICPAAPTVRSDGLEDEADVPRRRYAELARELDAYIEKNCPDLVSRFASCSSLVMEKLLYTSDGTVARSYTPKATAAFVLTAEDSDGQPVELYEVVSDYGSLEDVWSPERVFAKVDETYEKLMKKREGVYPDPGPKQVILAPDLAGILAHEAVGHTVEADFVLSGSVGGPYLGREVASGMVTLVDFANTAFGARCP